jgi:hypothetical protein
MKKIILFLFTVVLISVNFELYAQNFIGGLITGLSTSQIDGDTQGGYNKLGFYGGFTVERNLGDVIGIKSELYYITKGAKENINGIEIFKTKLSYIELPVMLKIMPVKHVELDVGLAFSYLIKARMWSLGEEYPQGVVDVKDTQFSAIASGSYFFTDKMAFNVRFDYGFLPIKNNPNWYSNNLSFGIIYLFN